MADYNSSYTGAQIDAGIGKANTAYQKPSGGIPDSDIASASAWNAKAASTSVPASASVDSSTGVMSFNNSGGTQLFTVTLPQYNGEVV